MYYTALNITNSGVDEIDAPSSQRSSSSVSPATNKCTKVPFPLLVIHCSRRMTSTFVSGEVYPRTDVEARHAAHLIPSDGTRRKYSVCIAQNNIVIYYQISDITAAVLAIGFG